jgi:hypothetical protein
MSRKFLTSLDVTASGVNVIGLTPDLISSDPVTNIKQGRIYFNTSSNVLRYYTGASWSTLGAGTGTAVNGISQTVTISGSTGVLVNTNSPSIIISADPNYVSPSTSYAINSGSLGGNAASYYYPSSSIITASVAYATNSGQAASVNYNVQVASAAFALNSASLNNQPASYYYPSSSITTASVAYATNSGNSLTTSQTSFGNISASSLTTTGNVSIAGTLYVSGSTTAISGSTTAIIADPIIFLGVGNPANINDLGFVGQYNSNVYTGLLRDPSVSAWRLFSNLSASPTNTANFASVSYDPIYVGGWNIYSSSTTQTASISPQGYLVAPSANFTSSLQLNGVNVATQSYVSTASVSYATSAGNSASLNGQPASYYAPLASPNFTGTASANNLTISGNLIVTGNTASVNGFQISRKYVSTIAGTGSTTQFTYNHGLNTLDINAQVYQTSTGPDTQYANVEVDILRLNTSSVQISFAAAPSSSATYNLVIVG